ncbi:MAG: hypothetical protein AAF989_05620 [Planctomycetota bacterium]
MRRSLILLLVSAWAIPVSAHHPDRQCQPVIPRVDLIPPMGKHLPAGHRRTYNRPSYWTGKLAYKIAPESQEAMAWHRAEHRGDYECDRCRVVPQYYYPKPYEALRIGARRPSQANASVTPSSPPKTSADVSDEETSDSQVELERFEAEQFRLDNEEFESVPVAPIDALELNPSDR